MKGRKLVKLLVCATTNKGAMVRATVPYTYQVITKNKDGSEWVDTTTMPELRGRALLIEKMYERIDFGRYEGDGRMRVELPPLGITVMKGVARRAIERFLRDGYSRSVYGTFAHVITDWCYDTNTPYELRGNDDKICTSMAQALRLGGNIKIKLLSQE